MSKRGSVRNSVLDWWQTVLDETKELVDDGIDRVRDHDRDTELADGVAELQQAVAMLTAKLDSLVTATGKPLAKPGA
jgi:hypothetical protein